MQRALQAPLFFLCTKNYPQIIKSVPQVPIVKKNQLLQYGHEEVFYVGYCA